MVHKYTIYKCDLFIHPLYICVFIETLISQETYLHILFTRLEWLPLLNQSTKHIIV